MYAIYDISSHYYWSYSDEEGLNLIPKPMFFNSLNYTLEVAKMIISKGFSRFDELDIINEINPQKYG